MIKDFPNILSCINACANILLMRTEDVEIKTFDTRNSHDYLRKIDKYAQDISIELKKRVKETKVLIENGELDKAMEMLDSFLA